MCGFVSVTWTLKFTYSQTYPDESPTMEISNCDGLEEFEEDVYKIMEEQVVSDS